MFVDRKECHVLVVDNELWILESIVYADEVVDAVRLHLAEMMLQDDIENLGGSFVVARVDGIAQLTGGTAQFPVDALYDGEHQTGQPEKRDSYHSLEKQRPPDCHITVEPANNSQLRTLKYTCSIP